MLLLLLFFIYLSTTAVRSRLCNVTKSQIVKSPVRDHVSGSISAATIILFHLSGSLLNCGTWAKDSLVWHLFWALLVLVLVVFDSVVGTDIVWKVWFSGSRPHPWNRCSFSFRYQLLVLSWLFVVLLLLLHSLSSMFVCVAHGAMWKNCCPNAEKYCYKEWFWHEKINDRAAHEMSYIVVVSFSEFYMHSVHVVELC